MKRCVHSSLSDKQTEMSEFLSPGCRQDAAGTWSPWMPQKAIRMKGATSALGILGQGGGGMTAGGHPYSSQPRASLLLTPGEAALGCDIVTHIVF